jgi:hypothetical protein
MNGVRQLRERAAMRQRVRRLADHVAGVRGDDRATPDTAALVVDGHESLCLVVNDGAVDVGQRNRDRRDRPSDAATSAWVAPTWQLGRRVGYRWDDQARHRVGRMREFMGGAHIAGRIDASI